MAAVNAESVCNILIAALSGDYAVRSQAEAMLNQLDSAPGYGAILAEIMAAPTAPHLALLAGVILKRHVAGHWEEEGNRHFVAPEMDGESKAKIRQIMIGLLSSTTRKLRTSAALVISCVAKFDWPNHWPSLFDMLGQLLSSQDPNTIHGAVKALSLLVNKDFGDACVTSVGPVLFPQLLRLLCSDEYEMSIRARACSIWQEALEVLGWMGGDEEADIEALLKPFTATFVTQAMALLGSNFNVEDGCEIWLRINVLRVLNVLVSEYTMCDKQLPSLLPALWALIVQCENHYQASVVFGGNDLNDLEVDSDGDKIQLDMLVTEWLELIVALLDKKAIRKLIKGSLVDVMTRATCFMQVTNEQLQRWEEDVNAYIVHEDEDSFDTSVRLSALALGEQIVDHFRDIGVKAITQAASNVLSDQTPINEQNWRRREGAILMLGGIAEFLVMTSDLPLNLPALISNVLLPLLSSPSTPPCLRATSLSTAANLAGNEQIDVAIATTVFQATSVSFTSDPSPLVRIAAARAVQKLFERVSPAVVKECISPLLMGTLQFLSAANEDGLHLALETVEDIVKMCKLTEFDISSVAPLMCDAVLQAMDRSKVDGMIMNECVTAIQSIASLPPSYPTVAARVVAFIGPVLTNPDSYPSVFAAMMIDVATALCVERGLPSELISTLFPPISAWSERSDDAVVTQNVLAFYRAIVRCNGSQVAEWRDAAGRSGLDIILAMVARLLLPAQNKSDAEGGAASDAAPVGGLHSDNALLGVGELIIQIILKFGDALGPSIPNILKAVAVRLSLAQLPSTIASLVTVFARLTHVSSGAVVDVLSSFDISGQRAINVVMQIWLKNQCEIHSPYETKVTATALALLLMTNDERLMSIEVDGQRIVDPNESRRTRSQGKLEEKWTRVPLPLKAFSEILAVLKRQDEREARRSKNPFGDDDDEDGDDDDDEEYVDGEDDDEEEGGGWGKSPFADADKYEREQTAALLYGGGQIEDNDEDHVKDPVNAIDLKDFCNNFIRTMASQNANAFALYYSSLSPELKIAAQKAVGMPQQQQ